MPLGPLLVFGNQQPTPPANASVLTLYLDNPIVSGANAGTLTTTQPPSSTLTTGWTPGTTAVSNYARQIYNAEVAGTFGATPEPSSGPVGSAEDCWRYGPITGSFSLGTWYSSLSVIAVTSGGAQDGRARFRLWKGTSASGSPADEITVASGTLVGTTVTNLSTTVAQSSAASRQFSTFSMVNEYLFLQVAWEITGAGGAASDDVLIREGAITDLANGSMLVTAAFGTVTGGTPGGGAYLLRRRRSDWLSSGDEV